MTNNKTQADRKAGNLAVEQTGQTARAARVLELAERTFCNPQKAQAWLFKPLVSLDGRCPFDLISTTSGARLVKDILAKIASGTPA